MEVLYKYARPIRLAEEHMAITQQHKGQVGPVLRWCIMHFDLMLFLKELKQKEKLNETQIKKIERALWHKKKNSEQSTVSGKS